jgi:pyrroloquinoline quinone biosynthesis protein D
LLLNETGAAIVRLCDGARSIDQIVDGLAEKFRGADRDTLCGEVQNFLASIRARGLVQ